jgi:hypothetical protein
LGYQKRKRPAHAQPSTIPAFTSKKRLSAKTPKLPFFSREPSEILLGRSFVVLVDAVFRETGNQAGPHKGESKMENTAKKGNAPTHNVVIGDNRQVGKQIVTYWTKVGAAWAHEDGKFFIRIRDGISVSGQIAVFPVEKKEEAGAPVEAEMVQG